MILTRKQAAAKIGVTLRALASIEANDPQLVRCAGVRLMYRGEPTIRYRDDALEAWIQGRVAA